MGGLEKGMEHPSLEGVQVLDRIAGHTPRLGKSAGEELNWAYRLQDISTNEVYIGMFCKPNHITFIDESTWDILQTDDYKNITWYYAPNGYISRTVGAKDTCPPYIYLHQLITGHSGNGKGKDSIDHINQNKLDNRSSNLRITTQSTQNTNRGKVSRHSNARELPNEIQEDLPKYCVYYREWLNKEKTRWREFFTIEGHPKQNGKRIATIKSMKVTIIDKLTQAKNIIKELDAADLL